MSTEASDWPHAENKGSWHITKGTVRKDSFKNGGYTSNEMTGGGGATASRLWMQIHADTAGIPVCIPASTDAPSM